jgi:L-sorbose 1-phosphate reductase
MSNIERYRKLDYTLPAKTLRWELAHGTLEDIQLVEDARPKPGADEVMFRVDTNAICFSDIKVLMNPTGHPRMAGYDLAKRKLVPGHETTITIIETGPRVAGTFKRGGRYLVQADIARTGEAVGYNIWGGMLGFGVFPPRVQEYLIPIPDDVGYSQASLVEPWACVEASYRRADYHPEDRAVLMLGGAGPMGQMHVERAISMKRAGKAPALEVVMVTDISDDRLSTVRRRYEKRAAAQGLRLSCVNVAQTALDDAMRLAGVESFEYVVALAPVEKAVMEARRKLRKYGVLNVFAGFPRGAGALNMGDLHYDQQTVTGNSGSTLEDMKRVLQLSQEGTIDTNYSTGAVGGLRAGKEALRDVAAAKSSNKIVLYNQIPDLPLTQVEDMPKRVRFTGPVREQVAEGIWTAQAEREMMDALLRLD